MVTPALFCTLLWHTENALSICPPAGSRETDRAERLHNKRIDIHNKCGAYAYDQRIMIAAKVSTTIILH